MVQPESPYSSTRATITLSGNTYYGHHLIKAHLKEFVYLICVRAPDPCRVKSSPPRFVPNSTDGGYSNVVKTTFNAKGIFAHWRKAYHNYVIASVVFSKNIPGAQRDQSRKVLLKKFNFRIDKRKRRVFSLYFFEILEKRKGNTVLRRVEVVIKMSNTFWQSSWCQTKTLTYQSLLSKVNCIISFISFFRTKSTLLTITICVRKTDNGTHSYKLWWKWYRFIYYWFAHKNWSSLSDFYVY